MKLFFALIFWVIISKFCCKWMNIFQSVPVCCMMFACARWCFLCICMWFCEQESLRACVCVHVLSVGVSLCILHIFVNSDSCLSHRLPCESTPNSSKDVGSGFLSTLDQEHDWASFPSFPLATLSAFLPQERLFGIREQRVTICYYSEKWKKLGLQNGALT